MGLFRAILLQGLHLGAARAPQPPPSVSHSRGDGLVFGALFPGSQQALQAMSLLLTSLQPWQQKSCCTSMKEMDKGIGYPAHSVPDMILATTSSAYILTAAMLSQYARGC